tara:strand:- start:743 stop:1336 length:594 start_codon:yes stop_codon:yes gene_type:complete
MSISDVWAITPSEDDDRYRADAAVGAGGALTLITHDAGVNGIGYKISITSAGNDTGRTFTIVGQKVGDLTGTATTEEVTGGNGGAVSSTNFYSYIQSISVDAACAGNVKIGTVGSLALPRTRIRGFQYVGNSSAGTVVFNLNSTSGAELLKVNTPASATATQQMSIPGAGILTTRSNNTDFAIMTLTNVALITVFCG